MIPTTLRYSPLLPVNKRDRVKIKDVWPIRRRRTRELTSEMSLLSKYEPPPPPWRWSRSQGCVGGGGGGSGEGRGVQVMVTETYQVWEMSGQSRPQVTHSDRATHHYHKAFTFIGMWHLVEKVYECGNIHLMSHPIGQGIFLNCI